MGLIIFSLEASLANSSVVRLLILCQPEDLHLSSLSTLHGLLNTSQTLAASHHSTLTSLSGSSLASLETVNLENDIDLYIEFNLRVGTWKEPDGWGWEPAEGFYEEGNMNLEPGPKIVLQNRMSSRAVTSTLR